MSMWVHIAAIIRIDSFGPIPDEALIELFGKELHFHDSGEIWDEAADHPERFLPIGSEGSLHMSIWHNPKDYAVPGTTVSIFGDLRDCSGTKEYIEWFDKKCNKVWVRQAVITITDESGEVVTHNYSEPEEESGDEEGTAE